MASESFSLALQQRAAREVVSEEMPRRALATRLLLFCEITSALLMIELGLLTHIVVMFVVFLILPVLPHVVRIYAALCLSYRSTDGSFSLRPQLLFASILTNPLYSSFGLCRGQKENSVNALTTMLARFAFAAVLVPMVLNGCGAKYCLPQNWFPEPCNAQFRVCAIFNEHDEADRDTFILQVCCLAPLMGLALMVLIHLVAFIVAKQTNQPSLMNMPEKHELRQRIRTKAFHFEQQLQKEQLEHSIWCLDQNCIMDW